MAACELYGYARAAFVGCTLTDVDSAPDYVRAAAAGGTCRRVTAAHRRIDGTVLRVDVSAGPFEYAGCPTVLAVHRNVTEREKVEEWLRQAANMEAVGHLAGGIAPTSTTCSLSSTGTPTCSARA